MAKKHVDEVTNEVVDEVTNENRLLYVGSNPSYTLGKVRFEKGDSKEVNESHVEIAIASDKFKKA